MTTPRVAYAQVALHTFKALLGLEKASLANAPGLAGGKEGVACNR